MCVCVCDWEREIFQILYLCLCVYVCARACMCVFVIQPTCACLCVGAYPCKTNPPAVWLHSCSRQQSPFIPNPGLLFHACARVWDCARGGGQERKRIYSGGLEQRVEKKIDGASRSTQESPGVSRSVLLLLSLRFFLFWDDQLLSSSSPPWTFWLRAPPLMLTHTLRGEATSRHWP